MRSQLRHFVEKSPLPAAGALWAAGSRIVVALLWHWKGMIIWDLGVVFLCCLDYGLTFRGKEIRAQRRSPRHLLQGVSQEIEIVLSNWADLAKALKSAIRLPRMGSGSGPEEQGTGKIRSESSVPHDAAGKRGIQIRRS